MVEMGERERKRENVGMVAGSLKARSCTLNSCYDTDLEIIL